MKMGVDDSYNRLVGYEPKLLESTIHLFSRFAGIDRDDAVRALDKGLVGQTIAYEAPDPRCDFIHLWR